MEAAFSLCVHQVFAAWGVNSPSGCQVPLRKSCWGQSWDSGSPFTGVPGRGMGDRPPGSLAGKSWNLCHVPLPTLGTGGRGHKDHGDCHSVSWLVLLLVPTKGPAAQQWQKGLHLPIHWQHGQGLVPRRDMGTVVVCRLDMLLLWLPVALILL